MPLSNYALDRFVSQELSQLTECRLGEIASRYPQSKHWVSNFILNSIFGNPLGQEARKFAFPFLRRAEAVFIEYEYARLALIEFTHIVTKKPSVYFRALNHIETTIAMLWQGYTFLMRITGKKLFQTGDGSNYGRLNKIYNVSRHFNPSELPSDHLQSVWITNSGVQIEACSLSFAEIEEFLVEVGSLADRISRISPEG